MPDYIRFLRDHVGHVPIILNFAGGVVQDNRRRVLLQRRGDREAEMWGFPGGAVELGESVAEAAVREIAEETGLNVEIVGLLGIYSKYTDTYPNGDQAQCVTTFFRCEVVGGELTVDGVETLALGYFDLANLPPLVNDQHRDAVADLRAGRSAVWR